MSNAKRRAFIRANEALDSGVVVDVMDGDNSPNIAKVMRDIRTNMLQDRAGDHTGYGVVFHTRGASACGRPVPRVGYGTDMHGVGDSVQGQARTIGIGSLRSMLERSMLERSNVAAQHKIAPHRLNSSGQEFVRWRNVRARSNIYQLCATSVSMAGHHPMHRDMIVEIDVKGRADRDPGG